MNVQALMKETEPYIIEKRRYLHAHPELSCKEFNTSKLIFEELESFGQSPQKVGDTGVIAVLDTGIPGKAIALRADIDALPVEEETNFEFKSQTKGCMHACGHDAHVAMLLGAAKVLTQIVAEQKSSAKPLLSGKIIFIFQAAEEIGLGYKEVLDYLEKLPYQIDQIIGLHIWSTLPNGEILLIPQAVFAGGYGWDITVKGEGGHGARPDLTKDPLKVACELVLKLASIPSNYYDVLDHSVVSTGEIQSGSLGNIIPSQAKLSGTIRWFKAGGGQRIIEKIKTICKAAETEYGVTCELNLNGGVPPAINNPQSIERAKALVDDVDGLSLARNPEPICASDNYGYLVEKYPGFYGILGAAQEDESGTVYPQHHPKFQLAEDAFRKGSEFMVRYVINYLSSSPQ